ncbi:MAG: S8 family serine peptidase [Promethearchaeota archaeon]
MNRKRMSIVFLGIIFFSQLSLIMNSFIINNHYIIKFNTNSKEQFQTDELKTSDDNLKYIIVSFNTSSFNGEIKTNFTNYGGIITNEWNNTFSSFSGFAGSIPEVNFTNFKNNCPNAYIEDDEIIEAQMNYAALQVQSVNSTWYSNGFKGNTNSSIAVLDTGINPNHDFFPSGYNNSDLKGNIVGWKDLVNNNVNLIDDNGHGTYISAIIGGTGKLQYNSSKPVKIFISGNYSHFDLFNEYDTTKNYTIKLFTFNISDNSKQINISSIWRMHKSGIKGFWIKLYRNSTLVNITANQTTNVIYNLKQNVSISGYGIYDVYLTYLYQELTDPVFSFNINVSYLSEYYIKNYTYFTGIANGTKIVSYKILNQSGLGYISDVITALGDIIHNRTKYHIISACLSFATLGESVKTIGKAINETIENGIIVVIAAGNYGVEYQNGVHPLNKIAQNRNAIVVGAINDIDQIASYSSMGVDFGDYIKPDIVAPGGSKIEGHRSIVSAIGNKLNNTLTGSYGTSIATAIVSAAINILIDAKWGTWNAWNNLNVSKWAKILKATLLMTASETNLDREDDPLTDIDESNYSPTSYYQPLTAGLKDVHEGYGRLNIQAAIDALTKRMNVGVQVNDTLISSKQNPLGKHVFARRINFTANIQYNISLTYKESGADFDVFIFSNKSDQYGEPILLASSRKAYGDFNNFYFTPTKDQTECIIIVKAISGNGTFYLNISSIENNYVPELKIPEIGPPLTQGSTKNTTVISYQESLGNNPDKNYTIDQYTFYIEYWDNDTTNVPPQEIYLCIIGLQNYTMTQVNPLDNNYTDGALFSTERIQFKEANTYNYYFVASDGLHKVKSGTFKIKIEYPTGSKKVPIWYKFNDYSSLNQLRSDGWKIPQTDTGWDIITQSNLYDDRSRLYPLGFWRTLYFGRQPYVAGTDYTYQPVNPATGQYPNGSITTPLLNLTGLGENFIPIAKFGIRVSINSLDYVYLQINVNWSGWTTLKTYTNMEQEWYLEQINLTQYKGSYIQFKIDTNLNAIWDPIKNRGFMLDYFAIENYTNNNKPVIYTVPSSVTPTEGNKYEQFQFYCNYYDADNNYPEYIRIEIDNGKYYDLLNLYGDWWANSTDLGDTGIQFSKKLIIGDMNRTYRFVASDGKYVVKTEWINENDDMITFSNPEPRDFNVYKSGKFIGYNFTDSDLSDYYVAGTPTPEESTAWLAGDNTWHPITFRGEDMLYCGIGQVSIGQNNQGYGTNWNAELITRPVYLKEEYDLYLMYNYNISLQPEVPPLYYGTPDYCDVYISTDYGDSWDKLVEYKPTQDQPTGFAGHAVIDLTEYRNEVVMIRFRLRSNSQTTGFGLGWFLYNIYLGYDPNTDFIAPVINILSPDDKETISSNVEVKATITDDIKLDIGRIQIYINDEALDNEAFSYNNDTNELIFDWDTTLYDDGLYELKIVAFDEEGNRAEASIVVEIDNGYIAWNKWLPWIIFILATIIIGLVLFILMERKGKVWIENIRNTRAEKVRLKEIDREQAIKYIQELPLDEELKRPLVLHCKFCKSWFVSDHFDIMCPVCDHDKIYVAYNCISCHKWFYFEEPSENYYCPKCSTFDKYQATEGPLKRFRKVKELNKNRSVRLIRREREEVEEILESKGLILREFKPKKDSSKISLVD